MSRKKSELSQNLCTSMSSSVYYRINSVQLSLSVVSDSLWPHGLQHTRPPCPSPTPGVYSNSCPLSWWCHPTISSFSSHLQSFPASGSFQMSQFFASGGQGIWVSASVLSMNIQDWFPLDWLVWLLAVQGTLKGLLQHHSSKASILQCSAFFIVQILHPYMTTGKTIVLTIWTFVGKVMSLLFNMLSSSVIAFLPKSISFPSKEHANFHFVAAVTMCSDFGAQENKVCHCFPIYLPWRDGTR